MFTGDFELTGEFIGAQKGDKVGIDEKTNNKNKNNQKKDEHRQNIDFFTSFDLASRVSQKVYTQGGCRRKKKQTIKAKTKTKKKKKNNKTWVFFHIFRPSKGIFPKGCQSVQLRSFYFRI